MILPADRPTPAHLSDYALATIAAVDRAYSKTLEEYLRNPPLNELALETGCPQKRRPKP